MARKIVLPPGPLRRFRLPDPGGRAPGARVVTRRWGTRLLGAFALTLFTLFVYWLSVSALWLPSAAEDQAQPAPQTPQLRPAPSSAPR